MGIDAVRDTFVQEQKNLLNIIGKVPVLLISLFLLSITNSPAQAAVESVPGIMKYCNPFEMPGKGSGDYIQPLGTAGCTYSTLLAAGQAFAASYTAAFRSQNVSLNFAIDRCQVSQWPYQMCYYYSYGGDTNPGPPPNISYDSFTTFPIAIGCPVPIINPTVQYSYSFDGVSSGICTRPAQVNFKITLSPATATIEPSKTYSFTATVTNQDGSAPSQPVPVSVKVEIDPIRGGHDHAETVAVRPKGNVSPGSGSTVLNFTFTAEAVSGTHTITAMCDQCVNKTATATVNVKVSGLDTLKASSVYFLVGGEPGKKHSDNHYLSAEAKGKLEKIVDEYNQAYPKGPLLRLNDASLVWGGKFDILGNWVGEHAEHRRGVVIDIRANLDATAIPEIRFFDFEDIAADNGAEAELHCSKEFSKYIVGCISDSGNNRHFHVRLLGKNARF